MQVRQPWHFLVSTRRYPFEAGTGSIMVQPPNPTPITKIPDALRKSLREHVMPALFITFLLVLSPTRNTSVYAFVHNGNSIPYNVRLSLLTGIPDSIAIRIFATGDKHDFLFNSILRAVSQSHGLLNHAPCVFAFCRKRRHFL